jgi:hypothetical protein
MRLQAMSGFNRLFLALTLLWALLCAVVYPLDVTWERQKEAMTAYNEGKKNCAVLVVERPDWSMSKDCYKRTDEIFQNTLKFYSFKNFWILPVALWQFFLPVIIVPPVVLYGLAALGVWVRNGFKRHPRST